MWYVRKLQKLHLDGKLGREPHFSVVAERAARFDAKTRAAVKDSNPVTILTCNFRVEPELELEPEVGPETADASLSFRRRGISSPRVHAASVTGSIPPHVTSRDAASSKHVLCACARFV